VFSIQVLSRELKGLTELGLLKRTDYQVVPPKVEYALTSTGHSLIPIIERMNVWGKQHLVRDEKA